MTKEQLLNYFIFTSPKEKEDAIFYFDVKGMFFYIEIMKFLNFDFSKNNKIEWSKVTNLSKYDKKLRNKIYIYLATLEEYIRAYISNKYEDIPHQSFWQNGNTKRDKVKTRIENEEKLSNILGDIDFGCLISQVKSMPIEDIKGLFNRDITNIELNLNAVCDLRNAVSHHNFLFNHSFKLCAVDGIKNDDLPHNLKNLRQLLPVKYRYGRNGNGGITAEIENCVYDFSFENEKRTKTKMNVESKYIVSIL